MTGSGRGAADLIAALRRWGHDRRGVSFVEFALLLPVMLSLYIGTFEISQAISAKRKVTLTAHTVADLVSRVTSVSSTDIHDIFSATTAIMAPFAINTSNFTLVVSSVNITAQGNATIGWSCASDGSSQYGAGQSVSIPAGIAPAGAASSLIWGTARYLYTPIIIGSARPFYAMSGPVTLSDQMYMAPRMVTSVVSTGC
jgi:hypothetical protein